MRIPFIAGNWKMYKTVAEAVKYVKEFRGLVKDITDVEIVLDAAVELSGVALSLRKRADRYAERA